MPKQGPFSLMEEEEKSFLNNKSVHMTVEILSKISYPPSGKITHFRQKCDESFTLAWYSSGVWIW